MSVAHQLDQPPSFTVDLGAASVAWGFIVARALTAPVCAMYLATLGKRAMVRREMYGNLLLTIGGTIQQILENLQFAADERLIEPLWRMQVLVDRASRAQTDEEMDRYDDELLRALGTLQRMRDGLGRSSETPSALETPRSVENLTQAVAEMTPLHESEAEQDMTAPSAAEADMPRQRYNKPLLDERLAATR
jgi:hypothetical protein